MADNDRIKNSCLPTSNALGEISFASHILCDLRKSNGIYLYNSRGKDFYIDFFSGTLPLGYNHPKLTEPDFLDRLAYVAVNRVDSFMTAEMTEFVEVLKRVAVPYDMSLLSLCDILDVLKFVFHMKKKKNPDKAKIIRFVGSSHGHLDCSRFPTLDSDGEVTYSDVKWVSVTSPKLTFPVDELKMQALEEMVIQEILDEIEKDEIMAILIEPIQRFGGDNFFRREFMHELRTVANEREISLIFDEIETGPGISGKLWAYEHYGIVPDFLLFGRLTQVCGVMGRKDFDSVSSVYSTQDRIVDMVRAQRILEIIEQENLVDHSRVTGEYLIDSLHTLADEYPELISNVRGMGLIAAFDVVNQEKRDNLIKKLFDNKLLLFSCGIRSIGLRPPLITSREDIDKSIDIIDSSIKELKA